MRQPSNHYRLAAGVVAIIAVSTSNIVVSRAESPTIAQDQTKDAKTGQGSAESVAAILREINVITEKVFASDADRARLKILCQAGEKMAPGDSRWTYYRGVGYDIGRDSDSADRMYRDAVTKAQRQVPPDHDTLARSAVRIGIYALVKREVKEAKLWAERALEAKPNYVPAYELLVDIDLQTGQSDETMQRLRDAQAKYGEQFPELVEIYFDALLRAGQIKVIEQEVDAKTKQNPESNQARYFRGVLAQSRGETAQAFALYYLAFKAGEMDHGTTAKAKDFCGRTIQVDNDRLAEPLRSLVIGYANAGRTETSQAAITALKAAKPATREQAWVVTHLLGLAYTATEQLAESKQEWEKLLRDLPNYPPALVGLGEVLEAMGDVAGADKLFAQAKSVAPNNERVRQIFRLGVKVRTHKRGVQLVAIEPSTPFDRFGCRPGDVITRLDDEPIDDISVIERLKRVRQWLGGEVAYITETGEEKKGEMELIYFP